MRPDNFRYMNDNGGTVALLLPVFRSIDAYNESELIKERLNDIRYTAIDRANLVALMAGIFRDTIRR